MVNQADIRQGKILIVDDKVANVLLLEQMLRGAGYLAVSSTLESARVCELHRLNHYDLILLDLHMPGLDGFQVMEQLSALEAGGYLPVLVITADPSSKLRALRSGAKDFVSKPFDLAEVLLRVSNMLEVRLLHEKTLSLSVALEQARLEAEQANKAKSAFLATMSHEIRTPLNGVIGMLEVLNQTRLRGDQVEMVALIQDSANLLLILIEDLLDFSKIEAGRLDLEQAPLDLAEVVERACALMDAFAEKKQVALSLFLDPAIPGRVLGDALRVRQVLINLLSNAIKFSARGAQGQVVVRLLLAEPIGDRVAVTLQVADNGIGMDAAARAGLFRPFTQADASTTRRFGGTGLGLAITHHLVELMGGAIAVQSEPEQGSTFEVQLGFALAAAAAAPVAGPGCGCLVLGDPGGTAGELARYLRSAGVAVEAAADLQAALERAPLLEPGRWVWVLDPGPGSPAAADLGPIPSPRADLEFGFVVIQRGPQRTHRGPRREPNGLVRVDGALLTRRGLLAAVALALDAGQADPAVAPVEAEPAAPDPALHSPALPSRAQALAQGRLVLIADDNDTNQKVLLQQLATLGVAAEVAGDGAAALALWRTETYGLLLTDLHMPNLDGYALSGAIRAAETGSRRLPIVALSATVLPGEAERCRAAGMDGCLTKPVSLEALRAMLERWLPAARDPVDLSILQRLVGADPVRLQDFLEQFRLSALGVAAELQQALAQGQTAQVGALAHKLKGSARSVGALALGDLCEALERAGLAGEAAALAPLAPAFGAEMAGVDAYLRQAPAVAATAPPLPAPGGGHG